MTEKTLEELRSEIELLKKQKTQKVALATSTKERDKLLMEINQLDAIKRSPSALKNFGKTFSKGLKMTGKALWGGISKASGNLNRNAPEYKGFAGSMFSAQGSPSQSTQNVNSISYSKPMSKKPVKKKLKGKKKKSRKVKARRMVDNSTPSNKPLWEMP